MMRRHATWSIPRSATFVFRFNTWKLAISHEASYAIAYALRASGAFPQLLGLERDGGRLGETPLPLRYCEVLALALKAVGTECRPYQSFDPMAGIVTSQPMSKITLHRMLPLEQRYYTKNRS